MRSFLLLLVVQLLLLLLLLLEKMISSARDEVLLLSPSTITPPIHQQKHDRKKEKNHHKNVIKIIMCYCSVAWIIWKRIKQYKPTMCCDNITMKMVAWFAYRPASFLYQSTEHIFMCFNLNKMKNWNSKHIEKFGNVDNWQQNKLRPNHSRHFPIRWHFYVLYPTLVLGCQIVFKHFLAKFVFVCSCFYYIIENIAPFFA